MAVTQTGRIVLLGVARSGTTWLASAMGHARSTRVVREPDNVDADPQGRAVGRMGFGPYPIIDRGTDSPQFRALWDVSFSGRVPNRRGARRAAGMVMRRLPRALREPLFRRTARTLAALPGRAPHVVVAHGESGVRSDRLEAAALDLLSPKHVTSLQPAVGHTMSACGAVNLAGACLMLADERIPAIPTLESPEMKLPFAMNEVNERFETALVNAIEPDSTASSALIARV